MEQAEFRDPRLVSVYDAEYGWSRIDEFFLAVANETPRVRVLDLGCGSGRLALALAAAGHQVTGLDPAAASLAAARAKPNADAVTWVEGTASSLRQGMFDLALMTRHVAQFFVDEDEWATTLRDLHRALVPGARLVFDSRDPRSRAWDRWNPEDSRSIVELPDRTEVDLFTEVTDVDGSVVSFATHYRFDDGTHLTSTAALRFRTEDELRDSLAAAGFSIRAVYGGWERQPIGAAAGELLVVAER
ncbi:class I SAM-dependent methyltransferase [Nitriliruptor alkaliphilus]|uniref:class I SAM-dependent methyltransferase n=1 Tax=Nitriliruptor alkaliphilus TaxID=427918 RepID=UPI000696321E|nr:class I SAM-dependent methyltransferase [Nitriliruptor alkaliphilus]